MSSRTQTPIRHSNRQERSRRTAQAIVDAATELFSEQEYERVSVAAIAARARVSVGCLYARFPDKAGLALAVEAGALDRARRAIGRAMDPSALQGQDVVGVLRSYVQTMLRFFQRHRRLMRSLCLRTRTDERYPMLEQVQEFNRFAHGMLCQRLLDRREEIDHPDPEEATRFGIMMISAAAREMILYGESRANLSTVKGRELEVELLRAFCGYLGCPAPRTR